jgi:ethanolamine-phosphate phospho-lyase
MRRGLTGTGSPLRQLFGALRSRSTLARSPWATEKSAIRAHKRLPASKLPPLSFEENQALRQRHLLPALQAHYSTSDAGPIKLASGQGQYLFDVEGRRYLDCMNNVCHVGHCHPRVVTAAATQLGMLNTDSRYLHDNIVRLAAEVTATMPDPLSVCIFVNSGSEANDLALRLARAYTGRRDVFCVEGAYHGNSAATLAISPYNK